MDVIASVVGVLGILGRRQGDVGRSIFVTKQRSDNYRFETSGSWWNSLQLVRSC